MGRDEWVWCFASSIAYDKESQVRKKQMTNVLLNIATRNSGCEMIIVEFVFQVKFLHYLCCFKYRICFMASEQLKISATPVSTLLSHCVFLSIFFFYSPWWMLYFYSDTECILLHVKLQFLLTVLQFFFDHTNWLAMSCEIHSPREHLSEWQFWITAAYVHFF